MSDFIAQYFRKRQVALENERKDAEVRYAKLEEWLHAGLITGIPETCVVNGCLPIDPEQWTPLRLYEQNWDDGGRFYSNFTGTVRQVMIPQSCSLIQVFFTVQLPADSKCKVVETVKIVRDKVLVCNGQ